MLRRISLYALSSLLAISVAFSFVKPVAAISTSKWQAGDIISDAIFTAKGSMTVAQIQDFLNAKVGTGVYGAVAGQCDTYGTHTSEWGGGTRAEYGAAHGNPAPFTCLKDYYEVPKTSPGSGLPVSNYGYKPGTPPPAGSISAAQIIYNAAQKYNISPKVLLIVLQKESAGPLITDDWPFKSQYAYAMGAHCPDTTGCDPNYAGFSIQVSESARLFRYYLDNMQQSWWTQAGDPSCQGYGYICGNYTPYQTNKILYNPDTSCGYSNVFLTNKATTALYTYTPYQPNKAALDAGYGNGDSCSAYGNRNFWLMYNDWFGSTWYPYAAEVTVNTYSDAAHTQPLSLSGSLISGQKVYVTVSALNTGNQSWSNSFTKVATEDPNNRTSVFHDSSWPERNRPARLVESSVTPGQTGTFNFSLTAPNTDGEYHEGFGLVADGQAYGWMQDSATFGFDITVSNPYNGTITQLNTYSDSNHTHLIDPKVMTYGETIYVLMKVKNTGNQSWSNSFTKVATEDPNNRTSVFHDSSWPEASRPAYLTEPSVAPGQTGTFTFSLTAPSTAGSYSEPFGLVAEGQAYGWMPAPTFTLGIKVVDPPLDTLYPGVRLYPGQSIQSKNGKFTAVLQGDGNFVIYFAGHPIWASHSARTTPGSLVMQGDGNLVLYTNEGVSWASKTVRHNGAVLEMQNDGNLVIYDAEGHPLWATDTVIPPLPIDNTNSLSSNMRLLAGQTLHSDNSAYSLAMQGDGNLVLYDSKNRAVWASNTNGKLASSVVLQGDGNLVLYDSKNRAVWASNTNGEKISTLLLNDDGKLGLYNYYNQLVWSVN